MTIKEVIKTVESVISFMPANTEMYQELEEAIKMLKQLEEVEEIVKATDFGKGVSLNKDGEDFGCIEAVWEIGDALGFEPTEEENDKLQL